MEAAGAVAVKRARRLLKKAGPDPELLDAETDAALGGAHTVVFLRGLLGYGWGQG
jgi:hypothetical protein